MLNGSVAPEVNDTFAEIKDGLQSNNELMEAIAEHTDAATQVSNEEVVAKRPANRIGEQADAPSVKKQKKTERTISSTVANARKFNANIATFLPEWLTNNVLITMVALATIADLATLLVAKVNEKLVLHGNVLKHRFMLYDKLASFGTRILNELKASGASAETIGYAEHYVKKLRGQRIIAIDPNETNANHISACQVSFTSLLQNYLSLVSVVAAEPLYNPILDELKPGDLQLRGVAMADANEAVDVSQAELNSYRRERNKCFNEPMTGLVDIYLTAKNSAKATYGVTSAEFATIKGLEFLRIKE